MSRGNDAELQQRRRIAAWVTWRWMLTADPVQFTPAVRFSYQFCERYGVAMDADGVVDDVTRLLSSGGRLRQS